MCGFCSDACATSLLSPPPPSFTAVWGVGSSCGGSPRALRFSSPPTARRYCTHAPRWASRRWRALSGSLFPFEASTAVRPRRKAMHHQARAARYERWRVRRLVLLVCGLQRASTAVSAGSTASSRGVGLRTRLCLLQPRDWPLSSTFARMQEFRDVLTARWRSPATCGWSARLVVRQVAVS